MSRPFTLSSDRRAASSSLLPPQLACACLTFFASDSASLVCCIALTCLSCFCLVLCCERQVSNRLAPSFSARRACRVVDTARQIVTITITVAATTTTTTIITPTLA